MRGIANSIVWGVSKNKVGWPQLIDNQYKLKANLDIISIRHKIRKHVKIYFNKYQMDTKLHKMHFFYPNTDQYYMKFYYNPLHNIPPDNYILPECKIHCHYTNFYIFSWMYRKMRQNQGIKDILVRN